MRLNLRIFSRFTLALQWVLKVLLVSIVCIGLGHSENAPEERDNVRGDKASSSFNPIRFKSVYSLALGEELFGRGIAHQRAGQHKEAIKMLRRATHITRVNSGLHTALQLPMIEAEIESLMHLNLFEQVDKRQIYLRKVQSASLIDNTKIVQGLIKQAEWQKKAYQLDLSSSEEEKMIRLIDTLNLYREALTLLAKEQGEKSRMLLEPLYGILRTQYLLSGFIGKSLGPYEQSTSRLGNDSGRAYRSQNFRQGKQIISAIYGVEKHHTENIVEAAQYSLTMLADWMLWNGKRGDAERTYMKATRVGLTESEEDLEKDTTTPAEIFRNPVPLPQLEGFSPLPETTPPESADLLISFDVTKTGKATNIKRLDDNDIEEAIARKIIRRISRTRFRPRLELGEVITAEGITYGFDTSKW